MECHRRFFSVRIVPLWNGLPQEVVVAVNLDIFKRAIHLHMNDLLFDYESWGFGGWFVQFNLCGAVLVWFFMRTSSYYLGDMIICVKILFVAVHHIKFDYAILLLLMMHFPVVYCLIFFLKLNLFDQMVYQQFAGSYYLLDFISGMTYCEWSPN